MSSVLKYIAVPALRDNYIWIVAEGNNAIVIDPGDAAPVSARLRDLGCQLQAILLTHHHYDHVGGVADLLREHTIPIYGPANEIINFVTYPVKGGDIIHLAAPSLSFTVLEVPGHTRGHIAFLLCGATSSLGANPLENKKNKENKKLKPAEPEPLHVFCGDTLFACGCGRLFEGTPQQMLASLDTLAALPESTWMHCAHEYTLANIRFALQCDPENTELRAWQRIAQTLRARGEPTLPTTIGQEKRINPFLRTGCLLIQQQLATMLNVPVNDRLTTFTMMRELKDRFQ